MSRINDRINDLQKVHDAAREAGKAEGERETCDAIAAWLIGLERRLGIEIARTDFQELKARRGVYEGIASEVLSRNWKHVR